MRRLATTDHWRCSDPGRFGRVVNRPCSTSDTSNGSVLDTVSTATTTQSWSLDALGNWSSVTTNGTAQTRTFNGQNQLTAVSGLTTPTYDHNGNMTKDQNGITYTYDAWNRMATDVGSGVETLAYLPGGQRASIAASGSTTSYSYFNDAWQEIELDNNTGASGSVVMQDTYVWGAANIDELVARDDASGNRLYAQQDANWDVTALVGKVSGTWQVVERFTYTSYGVATVLSASWASTTDAYGWVYRYQAGKYDSVSGLYNFRNRDYSPTLGQWLEADPAGYVQGANLYQANLGAPISHVDPYGLTPTTGGAAAGNNGDPTTQSTTEPSIPNQGPIILVNVTPGTQPAPVVDGGPGIIIVQYAPGPTAATGPGAPTSPPNNDAAALADAAYEAGYEDGLAQGMSDAEASNSALNSTSFTDDSGNTVIVPPDVVTNEYGTPDVFVGPDGLYHAVLWNGQVVPVGAFPPLPVIKITIAPTTQPVTHKTMD